jgi:competence protein ComFB
MGLRERYDFDSLENETENLVLAELESQMQRASGICTCQDCVLDMAACALNSVRPSYRVSLPLYAYAKPPGSSYAAEIAAAVREAIDRVQKNRSHD